MDESLFIVQFLALALSVTTLVVFFVMASNVSGIKKRMGKSHFSDMSIKMSIQLAEFKGDNEKAIDLLHERAFYWSIPHSGEKKSDKNRRIKVVMNIAQKISELGGTVSTPLSDFLEKNQLDD